MDYDKKIDIPFGAKDSELKGWEYTIPDGMEAEIKDDKVIVREKESEDERIRKELISLVRMHVTENDTCLVRGGKTTRKEAIAWIEKQNEVKKIQYELDAPISQDINGRPIYFEDFEDFQNLADQSNDEMTRKELVNFILYKAGNLLDDDTEHRYITYLERAKDHFRDDTKKIEQKPLSIEEIELNSISFLEQMGYTCIPPGKENHPAERSEEDIKKIRSEEYTKGFNDAAFGGKLKEWSEEDEEMLVGIIERGSAQIPPHEPALREEQMEWLMNRLKSLRPQPHWKPSEEQMVNLAATIDALRKDGYNNIADFLKSLYNDLKKL